jgi:hypothetical protein
MLILLQQKYAEITAELEKTRKNPNHIAKAVNAGIDISPSQAQLQTMLHTPNIREAIIATGYKLDSPLSQLEEVARIILTGVHEFAEEFDRKYTEHRKATYRNFERSIPPRVPKPPSEAELQEKAAEKQEALDEKAKGVGHWRYNYIFGTFTRTLNRTMYEHITEEERKSNRAYLVKLYEAHREYMETDPYYQEAVEYRRKHGVRTLDEINGKLVEIPKETFDFVIDHIPGYHKPIQLELEEKRESLDLHYGKLAERKKYDLYENDFSEMYEAILEANKSGNIPLLGELKQQAQEAHNRFKDEFEKNTLFQEIVTDEYKKVDEWNAKHPGATPKRTFNQFIQRALRVIPGIEQKYADVPMLESLDYAASLQHMYNKTTPRQEAVGLLNRLAVEQGNERKIPGVNDILTWLGNEIDNRELRILSERGKNNEPSTTTFILQFNDHGNIKEATRVTFQGEYGLNSQNKVYKTSGQFTEAFLEKLVDEVNRGK